MQGGTAVRRTPAPATFSFSAALQAALWVGQSCSWCSQQLHSTAVQSVQRPAPAALRLLLWRGAAAALLLSIEAAASAAAALLPPPSVWRLFGGAAGRRRCTAADWRRRGGLAPPRF